MELPHPEKQLPESEKLWKEYENQGLLDKFTPAELSIIKPAFCKIQGEYEELLVDYEFALRSVQAIEIFAHIPYEIPLTAGLIEDFDTMDLPTTEQEFENVAAIYEGGVEYVISHFAAAELPEEKKDPRVKEKLDLLIEELEIYEPAFKDKEVTALLRGSFFYGDPRKSSDLDIEFLFTNQENEPHRIHEIGPSLKEYLEISVDDGYVDLSKLRELLDSIQKRHHASEVDFFSLDVLLAGGILPLAGSRTEPVLKEMEALRKETITIINGDPTLRALFAVNYASYLDRAKLKRGETRPVYNT